MEPWVIVVIILAILIGLYIISFLFVLLFISNFNRRLKKQYQALNLLLFQKYDVVQMIEKMVLQKMGTLPHYYTQAIADLPTIEEIKNDVSKISIFRKKVNQAGQALLYCCEMDDNLYKDDNYLSLKKAMNEVDANYRMSVAAYNSDIAGYNYWAKSLFYRYLYRIFHIKQREMIV